MRTIAFSKTVSKARTLAFSLTAKYDCEVCMYKS